MKKNVLFFMFFFLIHLSIQGKETTLSAPIWVYLETVPGTFSADEVKAQAPPIQKLDEISRFVLSGMLYGWKFSYTPPDKTRSVTEYFSLSPIDSIAANDPSFTLSDITPAYPSLLCWARYSLNDSQKRRLLYWDSILFKNGGGTGKGERADESEGIKNSYTNAIMQAIREYSRSIVKNKPKEIKGEVKLKNSPRLFLDQGFFVTTVRVSINVQEMVPYRVF